MKGCLQFMPVAASSRRNRVQPAGNGKIVRRRGRFGGCGEGGIQCRCRQGESADGGFADLRRLSAKAPLKSPNR